MRVRTEHLKTGMTAREPVLSAGGQLLVAAGAMLSEHHLMSLRQRRIESIVVRGDTTAVQSVKPEVREAVERDVVGRFRYHDRSHAGVRELFRLAVKRRLAAQRKRPPHAA